MEQKLTFNSLLELLDALFYSVIDAETMSTKRGCFKSPNGYDHLNFDISEDAEDEFWKGAASTVLANPTPANILNLRRSSGWWMRRITWNGSLYEYTAGQDYPHEIRRIKLLVRKQSL